MRRRWERHTDYPHELLGFLQSTETLVGDEETRWRMWWLCGEHTRAQCADQLTRAQRLEALAAEESPKVAARLAHGLGLDDVQAATALRGGDVRAAAMLGACERDELFVVLERMLREERAGTHAALGALGAAAPIRESVEASVLAVSELPHEVLEDIPVAVDARVTAAVWERLGRCAEQADVEWCVGALVHGVRLERSEEEAHLARVRARGQAIKGLGALVRGEMWRPSRGGLEWLAEACAVQWLRTSCDVEEMTEGGVAAFERHVWGRVGDYMLENPNLRAARPLALRHAGSVRAAQYVAESGWTNAEEFSAVIEALGERDGSGPGGHVEELRAAWVSADEQERQSVMGMLAPLTASTLSALALFLDDEEFAAAVWGAPARVVLEAVESAVWYPLVLRRLRDVAELGALVRVVRSNPETPLSEVVEAVSVVMSGREPQPRMSVDESGLPVTDFEPF